MRQQFLDLALEILAAGDFKARWDVSKLLPQVGNLALAPLIAIVRDIDADIEERWFVGRLLGQFDTPEAVAALVHLLQETRDPDLAAIAASALAAIGCRAIGPLSELLRSPETCAPAAIALSQIPHADTIEPLLGVVGVADARVRATAVAALANFHDTRVLPALLAALQDYAAPVRKAAVSGLGLRVAADPRLFGRLQPLLHDLDPGVCQQAALAIGRSGSDAAAALLAAELQMPLTPLPLQLACARALAWMESPAALAGLARALPVAGEPIVLEIVRVLGRLEGPELKAPAANLLLVFYAAAGSTASTVVLQALTHAWSLLGHPDARATLQQLEEHPEPGVRLHARAALAGLPVADTAPEVGR